MEGQRFPTRGLLQSDRNYTPLIIYFFWKTKMRMKDESTQSALYLTENFMYLITGTKIETYRSSNKRVLLTSNGWCQYILDARG